MNTFLPKTISGPNIYNVKDCVLFKRHIISKSIKEYAIYRGIITVIINDKLLMVKAITDDKYDIFWINPTSIIQHYPNTIIPKLTIRLVLKTLWKDIIFRKVKIVKPCNIVKIRQNYINSSGFLRIKTVKSIDNLDNLDNYQMQCYNYFGFTDKNKLRTNDIHNDKEIFFSKKCYSELNLNIKPITGDFSTNNFKNVLPKDNSYICGLVENGEKGLFYRKWFICSKEFMTLWTIFCDSSHESLKLNNNPKTWDRLMLDLDTNKYSNESFNVEKCAIYTPNIYQIIAKTLFDNIDMDYDDLYKTYTQRIKEDLLWMKCLKVE